ncbi:hypothetical protein KDX38_28780, partial [Pseudomonas sp. CDFA 602]|nr:hypothetical protein [Pseudomonas californiensis]
MRIGSLSAGPCCEIDKFIVQVVGKDHDDSQKLILTSPDGSTVYRSEPETLEHERFSCLLEVWDHVAGAQLHLDIATVDGATLRLPLLSDTRVTPRQIGAQFNQLVPVLPFVSLPGSKTVYDLGTPVLARAGYVYVFYRQTLWRELEVRVTETGTTYHDIDVAAHRSEDGFSNDERPARGVALDDIWLPARWNNNRLQDLQLCFSEIQLSAPRLERLEKDATLRAQRCQNPDLICSNERLNDLYKGKPEGDAMLKAFSRFDGKDPVAQILLAPVSAARMNLDLHAFPVALAAPQRTRQPGYERLLDHPALYLCDLSGQYPVTALEQAKAFLAQADEGTAPPNTLALELTAVSDALLITLPSDTEQETQNPTDTTALWNAQPSVVDVLSKARQRQVYGVLLDDACYRIRHLRQRLETHQQLLGLCARLAIQH